jgi:mitochondrial chaperone BCS1
MKTAETDSSPERNGDVKISPGFGCQWLWRLRIQFLRKQEGNEEYLILRRLGTSAEPILSFIRDAEKHYFEKHGLEVSIQIAEKGSFVQKYSTKWCWRAEIFRNGREMDTVYLGPGVMKDLSGDLRDFLLPETEAKYRRRGIPYRRGYLLFGIPRSGKSTTIIALATEFKLDIRVITLNDRILDDGLLGKIFDSLPRRCILVLEDIDAVGIKRVPTGKRSVITSDQANEEETDGGGISLSGLLNCIDGVFAPEGYILMMTTNHIEKLDPALIGPGRVDYRVEYKSTTKHQAQKLFMRMFKECTETKLEPLADKFSEQVEKLDQSLAEIQNYLMSQSDPETAYRNVGKWCEEHKERLGKEKEQNSEANDA